jgi:hypothetical protein
MPKIERWDQLPGAVRQHLIDRMRGRSISLADLNQMRLWVESRPEAPVTDWYKDFGSFKICGHGSYPLFYLVVNLPRARPSDGAESPGCEALR